MGVNLEMVNLMFFFLGLHSKWFLFCNKKEGTAPMLFQLYLGAGVVGIGVEGVVSFNQSNVVDRHLTFPLAPPAG